MSVLDRDVDNNIESAPYVGDAGKPLWPLAISYRTDTYDPNWQLF